MESAARESTEMATVNPDKAKKAKNNSIACE
jgi:hypothetical protein